MPENNELANMIRTIIQEELKPVNERLGTMDERLGTIETGQQRIEATVNDIRAANRKTHIEIFKRLDFIVDDLKRLEPHEEKAVR